MEYKSVRVLPPRDAMDPQHCEPRVEAMPIRRKRTLHSSVIAKPPLPTKKKPPPPPPPRTEPMEPTPLERTFQQRVYADVSHSADPVSHSADPVEPTAFERIFQQRAQVDVPPAHVELGDPISFEHTLPQPVHDEPPHVEPTAIERTFQQRVHADVSSTDVDRHRYQVTALFMETITLKRVYFTTLTDLNWWHVCHVVQLFFMPLLQQYILKQTLAWKHDSEKKAFVVLVSFRLQQIAKLQEEMDISLPNEKEVHDAFARLDS